MLSPMKRLTTTWPDLNDGFSFKDYIKSKQSGLSVLQYYISTYPLSGNAAEWAQRIDGAQISINGVTVRDPQHVLRVGDLVSYARLPWREPDAPSYVDILYEDDDIVALSKPAGLQVLPAAMFHSHTVLYLLRSHYGTSNGSGPDNSQQKQQTQQTQQQQQVVTPAANGANDPRSLNTGCTAEVEVQPYTQQQQEDEVACHAAVLVPTCGGGGDGGSGADGGGRCHQHPREQQGGRSRQGRHDLSENGGGGAADGGKRGSAAARGCGQERGRGRGEMFAVPAPVHRLGRGTSGLLLCARTPVARRRLTELMTGKTAIAVAAAAVRHANMTAAGTPEPNSSNLPTALTAQSESALATEGSPSPPTTALSSTSGFSLCIQELPLRKIYRALVQGLVGEDQGRVDVPIGPIPHPGVDGGLFAASPDGKPAATIWTVLERRPPQLPQPVGATEAAGVLEGASAHVAATVDEKAGETLMQVEILTGRPHQIRIHMAALGHPLVGDPLYGVGGRPRADLGAGAAAVAVDGYADCSSGAATADLHDGGYGRPGDCGYHLHSMELHLPHPTTGRPLLLRAPPPPLLMTAAERAAQGEVGDEAGLGGERGWDIVERR